MRRALGISKVGHLGTLDPFATGVLPLMVGGMTRLADELHTGDKTYTFSIALGKETDTLDPSGQVVSEAPVPDFTPAQLEQVLREFRGDIRQVPPTYSALKHNGRPLYEYMRTQGHLGFDIESKARHVTVYGLETVDHLKERPGTNDISLRVSCSKGTYVRCLARDIARKLGTVGHCSQLERSAVGRWDIGQCLSLSTADLKQPEAWECRLRQQLLSPEEVFSKVAVLQVPEESDFSKRIDSGNHILAPLTLLREWGLDLSKPLSQQSLGQCVFISTKKSSFLAKLQAEGSAPPLGRLQPMKKIRSSPEGSPCH